MHKHLFHVVTTVARNEEKYDGLARSQRRARWISQINIVHVIYDESLKKGKNYLARN